MVKPFIDPATRWLSSYNRFLFRSL